MSIKRLQVWQLPQLNQHVWKWIFILHIYSLRKVFSESNAVKFHISAAQLESMLKTKQYLSPLSEQFCSSDSFIC